MKKKLFISCPMTGRTEENIKKSMAKMHKIAEIIFDQELEIIDTYIPNEAPEGVNRGVWYLGRSIEMMAEADYFIGVHGEWRWTGCNIELDVADAYKIPMHLIDVDHLMPDALEALEKVKVHELEEKKLE